MLSIMLGPLVEKQYWLIRTKEGLLDPDATVLYPNTAPETSLIDSVKSIGKNVGDYYSQHHSYPKQLTVTYRNPFTKKEDKPRMQQLTLQGAHQIQVLYAKLLSGLLFHPVA